MEFYDVGSNDLKELWDPYYMDSSLGQDMLMSCTRDDDWGGILSLKDKSNSCGVVLRDRLMTDAALGAPKPIKSEHSYSLLTCSSPPMSPEHSQDAHHHHVRSQDTANLFTACDAETSRIDVIDMEEEYFPAISMSAAHGRESPSPSFVTNSSKDVKTLQMIVDGSECTIIECDKPCDDPETASCQDSPKVLMEDKATTISMVSPREIHLTDLFAQTSDSEEDDEELCAHVGNGLCKLEDCDLPSDENSDQTVSQVLPPTPPSSASSDSESTASASCSPERRDSQTCVSVQNLRGFLQPRLYLTNNIIHQQASTATRQPIHTPLISCQPKGSTGLLVLTDEEKRTLVAEGYPVPTKLPLTKQEEKFLKKVRRKIKNKISAQESRRKKKEYMDGLERRVTILTNENTNYRDKVSTLESENRQLVKELQRLQALLQIAST